METVLFILAIVVMLIGLAGIIIPVLPGVPLIFLAALVYGALTDFADISVKIIVIFAGLAAFSLVLDWLAASFGVKRFGGSWAGIIGSLLGAFAGMVSGGVIGLIIGSFFGAFLFELLSGKEQRQALRAGWGSFVGFMAGAVIKFVIAAVMIGIFVWQVLF